MSDKITLQRIFDLAWDHFIVGDGMPSVYLDTYERIRCCYAIDGKKCAVGLALPEESDATANSGSFSDLVCDHSELFDHSVLKICNTDLNYFQGCLHDMLVDEHTGDWRLSKDERRKEYIKVAEKFNLTIPQGVSDE